MASAPQATGTLPSPGGAYGTAAALTQMGDELALMKARHQQLEWELKLVKQRSELEQQRRADAQLLAAASTKALPQVIGIDGVGKRGQATLQMPDGTLTEAGEGAVLPNGMRIQTIRAGGLSLLTSSRQRIDLPVVRVSVMQPPGGTAAGTPLPQGLPVGAMPLLSPARQGAQR